jgi:hypothetical protein
MNQSAITRAHWIIENFTDAEDYRDLIKEIKQSGRRCFVIDKNNHFDFDPSSFVEQECVVVQGSIQMAKHIASKLPPGCYPVAYNSWDKFLCSAWYPRLKGHLFNDQYTFAAFGELKKNASNFYEKFGRESVIFVRPDSGEKSFAGQLVESERLDTFSTNHIANNAADDDLIVVSTPKQIKGEWRFLCSKYHGGEIIASSSYRSHGRRAHTADVPAGASERCRAVLDEGLFPDSVFCVDVCEDADGNYWLLELTSFSSAGLYAMDKRKVAQRVSEIAETEYQIKFGRQVHP